MNKGFKKIGLHFYAADNSFHKADIFVTDAELANLRPIIERKIDKMEWPYLSQKVVSVGVFRSGHKIDTLAM